MLKLKLQYFGHRMRLEKTLMLGNIEGRRSGSRGWDGSMVSSTQWTWVWANSGRQWKTGKPGMLQSMGLQRVGHDLETEQQPQKPHSPLFSRSHSGGLERSFSATHLRDWWGYERVLGQQDEGPPAPKKNSWKIHFNVQRFSLPLPHHTHWLVVHREEICLIYGVECPIAHNQECFPGLRPQSLWDLEFRICQLGLPGGRPPRRARSLCCPPWPCQPVWVLGGRLGWQARPLGLHQLIYISHQPRLGNRQECCLHAVHTLYKNKYTNDPCHLSLS